MLGPEFLLYANDFFVFGDSLPDDDDNENFADEHMLPTLPNSTLGSTCVITPSSLVVSSASTASTLPPSTLVISPITVSLGP